MSDANTTDRLIVALDVPNAIEALTLTQRMGDAVSFYKIGLGMLTGGGLALALGVFLSGLGELRVDDF